MDKRSDILAIEISNPSAESGVAAGRITPGGLDVLGVEPVRPTGRGGLDDDLMPAIDRLCKRTGLDPRSGALARIAVSIGPGGYTSLRVACAAGKMIAAACGAKCVGVPTALVVLHGLPENARSGSVAVALASKSDSAWVQVFSAGSETGSGRLMTAADIAALAIGSVRTLIADRFLPAPMRDTAEQAGISIIEPTFDAAACLRLGATLPAIDPIELVPLYPREPDAVTLWRNRKV